VVELKTKREVIMMHLRDNISKREIARQTGLSRTTVNKFVDSYTQKINELDECPT
jgi:biotin operon repressor